MGTECLNTMCPDNRFEVTYYILHTLRMCHEPKLRKNSHYCAGHSLFWVRPHTLLWEISFICVFLPEADRNGNIKAFIVSHIKIFSTDRRRLAPGHKGVTVTLRLWVRSPLEGMKNLFKFIFLFLRSGVEVKRCWAHSTRNASKIQRKVGNRVS